MSGTIKNSDELKIPSLSDQVAVADEFLETWLSSHGISKDTIADIAIAVTELVNNAIRHGNKLQKDKFVTISLKYINNDLEISVMDEGDGFNPDEIPDPLAEENLLKSIGRGIFIVKTLIDSMRFEFPSSGGTKVIITQKID